MMKHVAVTLLTITYFQQAQTEYDGVEAKADWSETLQTLSSKMAFEVNKMLGDRISHVQANEIRNGSLAMDMSIFFKENQTSLLHDLNKQLRDIFSSIINTRDFEIKIFKHRVTVKASNLTDASEARLSNATVWNIQIYTSKNTTYPDVTTSNSTFVDIDNESYIKVTQDFKPICPVNCLNQMCDIFTGACNCIDGYFRITCEEKCPVNCVDGICDQVSGTCDCIGGYYGEYCNASTNGTRYTEDLDLPPATIRKEQKTATQIATIVVPVVIVVVVVVIAVAYPLCCKSRTRSLSFAVRKETMASRGTLPSIDSVSTDFSI